MSGHEILIAVMAVFAVLGALDRILGNKFGIYGLVASICNLTFDPTKEKNIGYKKD